MAHKGKTGRPCSGVRLHILSENCRQHGAPKLLNLSGTRWHVVLTGPRANLIQAGTLPPAVKEPHISLFPDLEAVHEDADMARSLAHAKTGDTLLSNFVCTYDTDCTVIDASCDRHSFSLLSGVPEPVVRRRDAHVYKDTLIRTLSNTSPASPVSDRSFYNQDTTRLNYCTHAGDHVTRGTADRSQTAG